MACRCEKKNPAAIALDKRSLVRQWQKDEVKARAARLRTLRAELRKRRGERRAKLAAVRAHCKAERASVAERVRLMRESMKAEANAKADEMRRQAKGTCVVSSDAVRLEVDAAARAVDAQRAEIRDARAAAKSERSRAKPGCGKADASGGTSRMMKCARTSPRSTSRRSSG